MKELVCKIKCQRGFGITLIFLVLLPLMLIMTVSSFDMAHMVQAGDMDVQEGLVMAAKSAASRVEKESQATKENQIIPADAHTSFRSILKKNIGLDDNLAPLTASYTSAPSYCLLVYNGTGLANKKYSYNGVSVAESNLIASGFPKSFVISGTDIVVGSGDGSITLDEPGVIAVITIKQKDALGDSERSIQRWAAAQTKKI